MNLWIKATNAMTPNCDILITLFNRCFLHSHNTELVGGGQEPLYSPASTQYPHHRVIFTHDYFASALHEIAHWCIAGEQRRLQEDYGYWYAPDGRTQAQQQQFEQVEVKPQAIEWLFARCTHTPFHFSADNINGDMGASTAFKHAVTQQHAYYLAHPSNTPERAAQFAQALLAHFDLGIKDAQDNYQQHWLIEKIA